MCVPVLVRSCRKTSESSEDECECSDDDDDDDDDELTAGGRCSSANSPSHDTTLLHRQRGPVVRLPTAAFDPPLPDLRPDPPGGPPRRRPGSPGPVARQPIVFAADGSSHGGVDNGLDATTYF